MNRRLVLKTVAICSGIFIMMISSAVWLLLGRYEPDTEKRYRVLVAGTSIEAGSLVDKSMLAIRVIRESAYNSHMLLEASEAAGKKILASIREGDYLRNYDLVSREDWYENDDRIVTLPVDVEGRLANLVRKGSRVDVRLGGSGVQMPPPLVLSGVRVEDVIDENGLQAGDNPGSKKAFLKLVLGKEDRDKIYLAQTKGRLFFELYCDPVQKPPKVDLILP